MGSLFGGGSMKAPQPIEPPAVSVSGEDLTEEGFNPLEKETEVDPKRALSKPTGTTPRTDTTAVV